MATRIKTKEKTMEFNKDNLPKTKEDWNNLKEQDIDLWANLTQENYDRTLREKRELETKYKDIETQKNNLTVELEKHRKSTPKEKGIVVPIIKEPLNYSRENLPQTDAEWEKLLVSDPVLGTDLRAHYLSNLQKQEESFFETRARTQKTLQEEHPDMYEAELDENNQPKLDGNGKVILKKDPKTGELIFNANSEKGKLWEQIFNENPRIAEHANAPELMQAAMERRLRAKGQKIVDDAHVQRERQIAEGQVITDGVPPPKAIRVSFQNEEEKIHAQRMVDRGLYRDLQDYVVNRDTKNDGIYDENRRPSFSSK